MGNDMSYKVVRSKNLSQPYLPRYVIVAAESGEVLNDAQGYGYKSAQKAHAAWAHKHKSAAERKERAAKDALIRAWCDEHPGFLEEMEEEAFVHAKYDMPFNTEALRNMLKSAGIDELPFAPYELLRFWRKH